MVIVRVIGRGYYTRLNGKTQEVPIGTEIPVKGIPDALKNKLEYVRDARSSEIIVNDNPEAAKFREEGDVRKADQIMSEVKEKMSPPMDDRPPVSDGLPVMPTGSD